MHNHYTKSLLERSQRLAAAFIAAMAMAVGWFVFKQAQAECHWTLPGWLAMCAMGVGILSLGLMTDRLSCASGMWTVWGAPCVSWNGKRRAFARVRDKEDY